MSTNGAHSAGGDGLGGDGSLALAPADGEILDDPNYSSAPEFDFDQQPAGGQQQEQPAGWDALGPEARELAEKKGWNEPADLAKAYRELESEMGRRGQRQEPDPQLLQQLARLQAQVEQLSAPPPDPYGGQGGDAIDQLFAGIDFNELSEAAGGDPGAALAIYQDQVFLPRLRAMMGGLTQEILEKTGEAVQRRAEPLEQLGARITLRDQAQELVREWPKDFPALRSEVEEIMVRNPALLRAQDGMKTAFSMAYTNKQLREQRAARASEGEALLGGRGPGQRGAPPVDPRQEIRGAISGALGGANDGL